MINIDRIAQLNKIGFDKNDHYSSPKNIQEWLDAGEGWNGIVIVKVKGEIAGFSMWSFYDGAIHTERRAVDKKYRGLGLGDKLCKKVIKLGEKYGYHYETYCALWNIASINSNINCGCRVTKIGAEFIDMSTKKRKNNLKMNHKKG